MPSRVQPLQTYGGRDSSWQTISSKSGQTSLQCAHELQRLFCKGRLQLRQRKWRVYSLRWMHQFVTRPFAPLSLARACFWISRTTVVRATFRRLAMAPQLSPWRRPFSISVRSARVRCDMFSPWNKGDCFPDIFCRFKRSSPPRGGEDVRASQNSHTPSHPMQKKRGWNPTQDTGFAELNARCRFCRTKCTKIELLLFPVTTQ